MRSASQGEEEQTEPLEGVAIIGAAGRFPGAPDVRTFWENLLAGRDSITRFTPEHEAAGGTASADYVAARGVLEDVGMFDAEFFGISPRDAERMDPQHRLFLEECSNCLEEAGYDSHEYTGEIGLFAGCSLNTYLLANLCSGRASLEELTANYQVGEFATALGNDKDFLTTRAAYKLNLRGPVVSVQSACATSLVAVCQASQALLNFQCDMALAGGVSITFPQVRGHVYQEGGLASGDGVCRPFDARATGTVFGHGVGVVLLKRLDDAVRDGDSIYAVIRGFAVNNDGSGKAGYMAPGVDGQARVIAAAQAMAGVGADTISYVEAHGTGTPLGDPIEVAALTKAFRGSTERTGFCAIGTAKGNIGHLDSAAGVTGLIKTALSLKHRTIPALAHFESANPNIDFAGSPFYVPANATPWVAEGPRRAGVSAFGVGGVNAHAVLEGAPPVRAGSGSEREQTVCLSAKSEGALRAAAANLAAHLEENPDAELADVAYTLAVGRRAFPWRLALAARDARQAGSALKPAVASPRLGKGAGRRGVGFLFSGQGSQFVGMGRRLYETEPVYREAVDAGCEKAEAMLGLDLRKLLFADASEHAAERLQETRYAQPALFLTEWALARLWESWGIKAQAVAGHSVGEYAAATLAGVFPSEEALRLVCLRGRLMQQVEPGAMLSVPLGEEALGKYVGAGLSIAALNSPRASVLSGSFEAIRGLQARLEEEGLGFRRLKTSHAFHSGMMAPMVEEFRAELAEVEFQAPMLPFVSTVTGTWISAEEAMSADYWAEQVLRPVRFADAVATLREGGTDLLLEVGPGEALRSLALHQRPELKGGFAAIASMPMARGEAEAAPIQQALGELWMEGAEVNWPAVYAGEQRRRVSLPTYPFERKLHWVEPPARERNEARDLPELPARTSSMPDATAQKKPHEGEAAEARTTSRRDRLQTAIAKIFSDLSGIETSAAQADYSFLELGFDSLFLTQATQSLNRAFGVKLTFRQVMEQFSTLASLAAHLDAILPAEAFAEPMAAAALPPPPHAAALGSSAPMGQSMERLLADQLAAMSQMFAQQVATLRAAAGLAAAEPASASAPLASQSLQKALAPSAKADSAEVKHGSFRPIQNKTQHELDERQRRFIADLTAKYVARTPSSKRLTEAARAQLADPRAVAGFRPQWKEMIYPLVTDRAQGSKIWDVDGNEYIDIVNGYGCIMFGHSPSFVVDAARAQLERGVAIGPQSALAGEVAALICELTGNERVTFCNTGSEAVMAAIRVARTVTGRDKLVYFGGDYHGTFDEVLMRATPRGSAAVAPGIPAANTSNVVVLEYGAEASLDYLRTHAEEIAAVLVEPVQTRNPGLQPMEFIREVRKITEQAGTAFLLDEVVTGFRLGPGGVQEMLGIRADMCTYGKVIGGGHPIGVLSGKAQFLDALDGGAWQYGDDSGPEVGVTFFAGTFVRHPLALAAARAVLHHLKESGPGLQAELNAKTAKLAESLDGFFRERGLPSRVHAFASWFYFTFPHDARLGSLFYPAMRAKGIHIQEGYPCFLTTAHSAADLQATEAAFQATIIEMQEAGALPGGEPRANAEAPPPTRREPAMHALALTEAPERVPLTAPQREVFLAAALSEEANCAFNESLSVRLLSVRCDGSAEAPVRQADLAFALDAVIARHDALRSTVCEDGEAMCFAPVFSGQTEFVDLGDQLAEKQNEIIARQTEREAETPFDLHRGPLLRTLCYSLGAGNAVLLLTAHHLVLDGWSANQLLEEVGKVYSGGSAALTELAPLLPFSSYAMSEGKRHKAGEFEENEQFWVRKFAGRSPRLDLPMDRPRPLQKSYKGDTLEGSLGSDLYAGLKKLSAKNGCTLYVTLLSAFQILMHRLSGQDEVVVGISTAGQALVDDASLVGHCVHFLPMLSEVAGGETVAEHLRSTRAALLDAYDHQEFTYGSLVSKLKLERDASRLPLIEVQFNLERVGANVHFAGLETAIKANRKRFVNTDLFLNVMETAEDLVFACDFNSDLFDAATVQRWMKIWAQQLLSETAEASTEIKQLLILPPEEREEVLVRWNATAMNFGGFEPVHEAFLREAAAHPQRRAVQCGGRSWSYGELAEYANLLARRLLREGLAPGDLVGICIERSLEMVGSLLAVMMAGGAYVPLDPRHPRERLASILADSGITILLAGRDPSVDTSAKILKVTGPQPGGAEALPGAPAADSLAYVIYTSGSTGVPKGVAVEHGALMNLLLSMQREPGLASEDVVVAVTTLAFDIAALELLLPLISGAKLVIATDEQVQDGVQLLALLRSSGATVLQATPGAWRLLIDAGWNRELPLKVLCGGEALPRDLAESLLDRSPDVWNMYGPTETTIWSSATRVTRGTGPLPVGPPIANTNFYVLDEYLQPAPVGVTGELYIGGEGLAREYWRRPELTEEKFLQNPFGVGRMYRTGDLGRWQRGGTIELLGRADFQVKLRGYRIELGDIEAALRRHEGVSEAVVVQRKAGEGTQLVGFFETAEESAPEGLVAALKHLLARSLPEYMFPSALIPLKRMPRTPNGKIDRKALPALEPAGLAAKAQERPFSEPASVEEAKLAAIWAEVLAVPAVSTTESIFELGADSLVIFRIAARAQREGMAVTATQIFQHRTIRALAEELMRNPPKAAAPSSAARIAPASREAYRRTKVRMDG